MQYILKKSGFTLVELMVVILIVGIVAALAIPLMSNAVESSKWAEARNTMGVIATEARTYYAEHDSWIRYADIIDLGITEADIDGTYFEYGCYTLNPNGTTNSGAARFSITCDATRSTKPGASTMSGSLTMTVNTDGSVTWSK